VNRAQKAEAVEEYGQMFGAAGSVVITHNLGLTVAEATELRNNLREQGGRFKVAKNTLAKRALKGTTYEDLEDMFAGPVGVAVSEDAVTAAKVIHAFAKTHDNLVIVGGAMGSVKLDKAGVENLAKMPSLDEIRSTLVGILQAPAAKLARVTQAPAGKLARVIQAKADKGDA